MAAARQGHDRPARKANPTLDGFDFKNPDYDAVFRERCARIERIRASPTKDADIAALKLHYRDNPADFICDWGMTYNPKLIRKGLPPHIPFILYPKQRKWVNAVVRKWMAGEDFLTEKTRQMGFSWLSMATSCTLCLFHKGMSIGFGSRKEDYVDKTGDPKSLFVKGRMFMDALPVEFKGGWDIGRHAPFMRMTFPESGSSLTGEAGDQIGRGATTSIYFVDESAHIEHPQLLEAALSETTDCRIDISTPNGLANAFADKRFGGLVEVFTFHWRDDPTKDDAWYAYKVRTKDPVTLAQEIDIDYAAAVEGVLIPKAWALAAVDAHKKIGIEPTGGRTASLDVADEGKDTNALCGAHGILIEFVEEWSGKGSDIFGTVQRAFGLCDEHEYRRLRFDSDGLGAGVRGDARIINGLRADAGVSQLEVEPFRGSEAVFDPEGWATKDRRNKDFFLNRKAQSWWALRKRFQLTYRAVSEGVVDVHDDLISISGDMSNLSKLLGELSRPTYTVSVTGKIVVDKAPEGAKSPNLADSVMIQFAPIKRAPMRITDELLGVIGGRMSG